MLKIAHIKKGNKDQAVRALSEIFKANDTRRQEKRVEQLRNDSLNKKAASTTNA